MYQVKTNNFFHYSVSLRQQRGRARRTQTYSLSCTKCDNQQFLPLLSQFETEFIKRITESLSCTKMKTNNSVWDKEGDDCSISWDNKKEDKLSTHLVQFSPCVLQFMVVYCILQWSAKHQEIFFPHFLLSPPLSQGIIISKNPRQTHQQQKKTQKILQALTNPKYSDLRFCLKRFMHALSISFTDRDICTQAHTHSYAPSPSLF